MTEHHVFIMMDGASMGGSWCLPYYYGPFLSKLLIRMQLHILGNTRLVSLLITTSLLKSSLVMCWKP